MNRAIEIIRFHKPVAYPHAFELQRERQRAVEEGRLSNALFLLEHEPVVTLGRNTKRENLLSSPEEFEKAGIALCEANRGGDVTYHGPGQLVGYPVLNLNLWKPSIRWYLRALEQILIDTLAVYGLPGERAEGFTGVWVGGAKVAAIGVGIHNWVTCHGVALNVDPDMSHFARIVPCGIGDKPITSLRMLLETPPAMEDVMDTFAGCFERAFGR
jgi:lipoyl(octanoyl) transferase